MTDALGNAYSYVYDKEGNNTSIILPTGDKVLMEYDAIGQLVKCTDAQGLVITYQYDGAGNRIYHSRVIDIDILFYGSEHISAPDLIIPHKDIENRPFVMIPLQEVAKPSLKTAFPEYFGTE